MLARDCIISFLCIRFPILCSPPPSHFSPFYIICSYGMAFNSFPYLGGFLFHLLFLLHLGRVFIFFQGAIIMRYTRPLICLDHTQEFSHGLIHALLQYKKLDNFTALVFQDLVAVLSDVIEYHFMFCTVI